MGTPEELRPIAEQVLAWVARHRVDPYLLQGEETLEPDDLRRIELCALAVREWSLFLTLYAPKPEDEDGLRTPC